MADLTGGTVIDLAEGAVRKVDLWGHIGLTNLSLAETEALVMVVAVSGAIPLLRSQLAAVASPETPEGAR